MKAVRARARMHSPALTAADSSKANARSETTALKQSDQVIETHHLDSGGGRQARRLGVDEHPAGDPAQPGDRVEPLHVFRPEPGPRFRFDGDELLPAPQQE